MLRNPLIGSFAALGALAVLFGCAAPAAPPVGMSAATAPAALVEVALTGLVEDAARLDLPSNDARFDALTALLRARGLDYEVQAFSNPRPGSEPRETGRNVIVSIGTGTRDLVLGAHYDAARLADGSLSSGMVDNAAGSVVLVRVAEALQRRPLRHRLRVVFFDMEELGLLGSAHYVTTTEGEGIAAMVNLDVAGYGEAIVFGPAAPAGNERVYREMWRVCAERPFPCIEFPAYPPSDDRSFQAAGVPNISIAVLPRTEAHQMWLLLNARPDPGLRDGFAPRIFHLIHSPDDTVERLEADAMTLAYTAVLDLLLRLDAALR